MNIFHSETNEPMGVINWFAVHPTSMNNTNHLISGDNKGLASQLMEKNVNPIGQLTGTVSISKSLSEALLFAEHGENMLCTKIVLNVRKNFCTQHVLPRFELGIIMY
jgi:hypothetical protein